MNKQTYSVTSREYSMLCMIRAIYKTQIKSLYNIPSPEEFEEQLKLTKETLYSVIRNDMEKIEKETL